MQSRKSKTIEDSNMFLQTVRKVLFNDLILRLLSYRRSCQLRMISRIMVGSFDVRCQEKRCSHHSFNPFDIHVLPIGINLPVSEHSTAEGRDAAFLIFLFLLFSRRWTCCKVLMRAEGFVRFSD